FLALAARAIPWLAGITALCFSVGLYLSFATEGDYQQCETVRIMYVHVPSAWLSMMCYTIMSLSAIGTLVWRHPLADVSAKAAAPLGAR
ncbi:cytochrome c biogenesis protein CcsA, partial [Rhizobium johnstonii]|uniref:cytochrome c biogenesis protein CcsA n=1 Tax=Rhizobium johnstonii TaxID=3019933 RepID=UPI003F9D0662